MHERDIHHHGRRGGGGSYCLACSSPHTPGNHRRACIFTPLTRPAPRFNPRFYFGAPRRRDRLQFIRTKFARPMGCIASLPRLFQPRLRARPRETVVHLSCLAHQADRALPSLGWLASFRTSRLRLRPMFANKECFTAHPILRPHLRRASSTLFRDTLQDPVVDAQLLDAAYLHRGLLSFELGGVYPP